MRYLSLILLFAFLGCFPYQHDQADLDATDDVFFSKKSFRSLNDLRSWLLENQTESFEAGIEDIFITKLGEIYEFQKDASYKALINFVISDVYWQNNNKDMALFYMSRINKAFYEIEFLYRPIGYYIGLRIISMKNIPYRLREEMYVMVLDEYNDYVDTAHTSMELLAFYKENLDIDKAYAIMKKVTRNPRKYNISLKDNLAMKEEMKFYKLNKNWVYQDLETLIKKIQYAVTIKNSKLLKNYISKRRFYVELFQKKHQQRWTYRELGIHRRWNNRIVFAKKLEGFSSETEAYLRSDNWNFPQMRTWYFKFNRIDYPYNTEFNGGWEWSGICFGDPFLD